jgi:hypothetical protein
MRSVSVAVRAGVLVAGAVALVAGPVAPAAYGVGVGVGGSGGVGGGGRDVAFVGSAGPALTPAGAVPASPVAPVPAGGGYAAHVAGSRAAPRAEETGPTPRQFAAGLLLTALAVTSAVLAARVRRPDRG